MSKAAVERLTRILAAERHALLIGDLDAVAAMTPEKEDVARALEGAKGPDLRRLSAALAQNGALLTAARTGVGTVIATLQNQRVARTSLSSYDRSGKATTISKPVRGADRRF